MILVRWLRWARELETVGVAAALAALVLFFAISTDTFLTLENILKVLRQTSDFGILALGMVFVLTLGEVDLSVGSILTLVNVLTAVALREGLPPVAAALLGLAAGAACGLVNGVLAVVLRIPSIIVTLGTMGVFRGLALVVSKASPVSEFPKDSFLFTTLGMLEITVPPGAAELLGVSAVRLPASILALAVFAIVAHVALTKSVFGRRVQAIGSSPSAARCAGIRIARHRIAVMALSGAFAATTGILALCFLEAADPKTGEGAELLAIASAVIGGTLLTGGSGSALGAVLGALVIAVIRNGLVLLGLTLYWNQTVIGAMIIAAVSVDYLVKKRR